MGDQHAHSWKRCFIWQSDVSPSAVTVHFALPLFSVVSLMSSHTLLLTGRLLSGANMQPGVPGSASRHQLPTPHLQWLVVLQFCTEGCRTSTPWGTTPI